MKVEVHFVYVTKSLLDVGWLTDKVTFHLKLLWPSHAFYFALFISKIMKEHSDHHCAGVRFMVKKLHCYKNN